MLGSLSRILSCIFIGLQLLTYFLKNRLNRRTMTKLWRKSKKIWTNKRVLQRKRELVKTKRLIIKQVYN
jgi:hypothetical protein